MKRLPKHRKTLSHVEVINHKITSRALHSRTSSGTLSSAEIANLIETKSSAVSSPKLLRSQSSLALNSQSPNYQKRLVKFQNLQGMLESAEVDLLKCHLKQCQREFKSKLDNLKHIASIDRIQAREARTRRWQKNRFAFTKEEKELTNREIGEIVGQWRREMKRFLF
mmetsp:Transcript_831/g.1856  ORF Transcript_831/g.1856 Transcript_831/m.1856 type:complete len:167 (-) Transcript_831:216-716(-)